MEPEYLVVLYSKYSPQCLKILQIYDKSTMDYIKLVCIDNANVRERLAMSKTLQVKTVPCVLLMYPGNKIEKFEGINVTDWILNQIAQNLPSSDTMRTVVDDNMAINVPMEQPQPPPPQQPPQQQYTSIEDLQPEEDDNPYAPPRESMPIRKEKSIGEIAAEMASERDGADKPAHIQMQEMQDKALSQIP